MAKLTLDISMSLDGYVAGPNQTLEQPLGEGVAVGGGADVAQQYLKAGLLAELQLHVVPVLLGDGVRLFANHQADAPGRLECASVVESPTGVTHLSYRVLR